MTTLRALSLCSLALSLSLLTPALPLTGLARPGYAEDEEDKANYTAEVVDNEKTKTVLRGVTIRAGGGLFAGGSGKKELEVRKDGGKMKIKVPFKKIKRIVVTEVTPDYVAIEISSTEGQTLKGHIATNVELAGMTDFGDGAIRIRDANAIDFRKE